MRALLMLTTMAMLAPAGGASAANGTDTAPLDRRDTAARQPITAARPPIKIVAFGDSLTSGHRLPRDQAYPAVLEALLKDAGVQVAVVNHGVSGDTTSGAVRRLDAALAERPDILIVAFGANDGLRGVPVAEVTANLDRVIGTAKAGGIAVLLVGMEALPLHGWPYTVEFHKLFPALAARHGVPLVPFMLQGLFGNRALMSPDGVHPNAAGARVIATNLLPYVRSIAESLARRSTS
jgi:acyl-CoA thioesterase-1